jgi:Cd2+/Zn2+-exporting ATPase
VRQGDAISDYRFGSPIPETVSSLWSCSTGVTVRQEMGAAGADTAIETADVALICDDLLMVSEAIRLGRRTLGVIRFNLAFAVGINAIFLILALLGHTSLWLAVLADTGATLLVIANALRLLR